MATRTIDILLNLEAKPKNVNELSERFKTLEKRAQSLRAGIDSITSKTWLGNSKNVANKRADELRNKLNLVEKEIKDINAEASKRVLEKNLQASATRANQLRERMEKVAQVGNRMIVAGSAIVAPFLLSMRKYVDMQSQLDPSQQSETYKQIVELQKDWADSQAEIGQVTAEILVPVLRDALDIVKQIAAFAKEHPGAIKAALGIGGTLVVLGGMLSTAATIVSTIATVQGLAAGLGIGGAAAGGVGLAGLGASIASAIAAAAPFIAIAAAVVIAAEGTRQILNWALGTNQTWADIGITLKQLGIIIVEGWKAGFKELGKLISNVTLTIKNLNNAITSVIRNGISNLVNSFSNGLRMVADYIGNLGIRIWDGISSIAESIRASISGLFSGSRASGGYVGSGVYRVGERGREFVLSNSTTRAAESMMGGQLNQERMLMAMAGGKRFEYNDNRRIDSQLSVRDRRIIAQDIRDSLAGAL